MTNPTYRVAQPGDIFMLLVPSASELNHLRQWQAALQRRYGGRSVEFPHITCQRFTPPKGQFSELCITSLKEELNSQAQFMIYTDRLIQFYAPYWDTQVLRWRVQESVEYAEFRDKLGVSLAKIRCPSHFNRLRHATCTALNLEGAVNLESNPEEIKYPVPLFKARELLVSKLVQENQFEILDTITLSDP